MFGWLTRRSTGDVLVLLIAGTICGGLLVSGAALIAFQFIHPDDSTEPLAKVLVGVVNTLIGLLAGFLAGRTDLKSYQAETQEEPDDPPLQ